jgi:HEAT repeat protein
LIAALRKDNRLEWQKGSAGSGRFAPADALGRIGPAAVPDLVKTLDDPDARMRAGAVRALGAIGRPAKKAVPALERLSEKDPDETVREAAGMALKAIR